MEEDLVFSCELDFQGWPEERLIDFFVQTISGCDPHDNDVDNLIRWIAKGRSFSNVFEGEVLYNEFLRKIYDQLLNYRTNVGGNIYAHAFVLFIQFADCELSWMLARQTSNFSLVKWDYKVIKFQ